MSGETLSPSPEARQAIADVIAVGLWALDTRDLELYLGTYWADAVFSEVAPDGVHHEWRGIDDIRAVSAARTGGPTGRQHRLSNQLYTPLPPASTAPGPAAREGWTVWAYWMTTVRHPATGEAVFEMSGYLRDEVECRSGEWRLIGRHLDAWPPGLAHPLREAAARAEDVV
ncbi:nuclear transport factor 2 family protein [Herbiconiux moechotypicola]|uniref:SnoaL-like domain-containing protein n=1 Tax=Herbiconiux moechotypicola TaxID=637393 RepID=A0ABP5QTF5_9MICO|nr:nuclear transport factor 2 family protein [Herbiconiux moechotypicola]MCS5730851.1 nuclear transport factor 2 family protein [Herbiconiux moechotypicola]